MRSKSFSHFPRYLVKRRRYVVPSDRRRRKINRYPISKFVICPAKLKLPNVTTKSSPIRPAKLNLQNTKLFLLKPPTLLLPNDAKTKKKKSRFSAPSLLQSTSSVPLTAGKVFDSESLSHANFKSLVSNDDCEIIRAFDTLSFKQLRSTGRSSLPAELGESSTTTTNKRESTSTNSCSVQARMESSVPPDCDDTSIDELASYFDLFVHIPKKMSSMAEMMYI